MQIRTALAEAQRRWGKTGAVRREKCRMVREGRYAGRCSGVLDHHKADCPGRVAICTVGKIELNLFFAVRGNGPTFEAAFADVDRRAARDRANFCRSKKTHDRARRCRVCKYRGPPKSEGLAELQPDGTLLTTDERVAAWQKECAEARARREAERAEAARAQELKAAAEKLAREEDLRIPERAAAELERRQRAEARMMTGREPTAADVAAVEGEG